MRAPDSSLLELYSSLNKLHTLRGAAWAAAVPHFSYKRFPAGAYILEAGNMATELYFLTSGVARMYYLKKDGKEFNKSFSIKGQALSSISSLVMGEPSPFYVQALVSCECLSISYRDFLILSDQHRGWERLRVCLLEQLAIKQERRAADFLLLSAEERYEKFLRDYAHVAELIPNYHVASYLGITEVALSRIRRRMGLTRVNASGPD